MASAVNKASALKLVYELPAGEGGKMIRRTRTYNSIKVGLAEDVLYQFAQKLMKLQVNAGKVQKADMCDLVNE